MVEHLVTRPCNYSQVHLNLLFAFSMLSVLSVLYFVSINLMWLFLLHPVLSNFEQGLTSFWLIFAPMSAKWLCSSQTVRNFYVTLVFCALAFCVNLAVISQYLLFFWHDQDEFLAGPKCYVILLHMLMFAMDLSFLYLLLFVIRRQIFDSRALTMAIRLDKMRFNSPPEENRLVLEQIMNGSQHVQYMGAEAEIFSFEPLSGSATVLDQQQRHNNERVLLHFDHTSAVEWMILRPLSSQQQQQQQGEDNHHQQQQEENAYDKANGRSNVQHRKPIH